jgi:hypothetical protein
MILKRVKTTVFTFTVHGIFRNTISSLVKFFIITILKQLVTKVSSYFMISDLITYLVIFGKIAITQLKRIKKKKALLESAEAKLK